ncbi:hypothetical protein C7I85_23895 [Mesorhizobium soli]|uniref:Uncharacterized protein n=1 Tax=Pseudaminobacter soli (ex Li et al. 2025) TaxID=1295366 RepID=A0A2P7S2B0_9HYPH|nr:hypothetical protein C7I85_23895 [Mesorhizobium soli]
MVEYGRTGITQHGTCRLCTAVPQPAGADPDVRGKDAHHCSWVNEAAIIDAIVLASCILSFTQE